MNWSMRVSTAYRVNSNPMIKIHRQIFRTRYIPALLRIDSNLSEIIRNVMHNLGFRSQHEAMLI